MPFSFNGYEMVVPASGSPIIRMVARMPGENKYYAVAAQITHVPVGPIPFVASDPCETVEQARALMAGLVLEPVPPVENPNVPTGTSRESSTTSDGGAGSQGSIPAGPGEPGPID